MNNIFSGKETFIIEEDDLDVVLKHSTSVSND